jgi:broad specificity phosphatase PhoE
VSVLLLRHARAGERAAWTGDDTLRPLDERGLRQALALRNLSQRAIGRIVSSPYRRCVETVEPLADALGLPVELDDRLAEGAPPKLALELLAELDGGLACTHGDVIEAVLGYGLRKGAVVVADVGREGAVVLEALPAP